ncbi:MAG: hypothetical protein AABZ12_02470 [Planctomycetota bacterium]
MTSFLFVGAIAVSAAEGTRDYPTRLRRIMDAALGDTAQVEWTLSWVGGSSDGLVERRITRVAGESVWESNLGDEHGFHDTPFVRRSRADEPTKLRPEETVGTRNMLIHEGTAYYLPRAEEPWTGDAAPLPLARSPVPLDFGKLGLAPALDRDTDVNPFRIPQLAHEEGFESAVFTEGWEDGRPIVNAEAGARRVTWTFDDSRGGQPIRAALYGADLLRFFSETELEQVGGKWFPKSVRFYRGEDPSPYKIVDVQQATFNEPSHMQEITPDDIGVLYGTQMLGPTGLMYWTGDQLITDDEYMELVHVFDVLPDPLVLEYIAGITNRSVEDHVKSLKASSEGLRRLYFQKHGEKPWLDPPQQSKDKDEWDVYVDKFIAKHKLEGKPVERAQEILKQAKKMRDGHLRKNRANIRKAEQSGDKERIAHYQKYPKQVFDRYLVKSLEKLVPKDKDKGENKSIP